MLISVLQYVALSWWVIRLFGLFRAVTCRAENPSVSSLQCFLDKSGLVFPAVGVHCEFADGGLLGGMKEEEGVYAEPPQQFHF